VIAQSLPDNGRYQWLISDTLSSSDCYIRFTIVSGSDTAISITPAYFEIIGSSSLSEGPVREKSQKEFLSVAPTIASRRATCEFRIGEQGPVEIVVYDVAGRMVKKLLGTRHAPACGAVLWDCMDGTGVPVQNGIYFIQLKTKKSLLTEKLTILR
jgi:hypothetical protein